MTQLDRIEELFFESRRSAFMVSFLSFIGTAISLVGLSMLDPALGIVIPILIVVVLTLFTGMFLLLAFRLFQPINEIVIMINKLFTDIMVDELGAEPAGAAAETEKQPLEKLTQQVNDLTKEISVLKKEHVSSTKGRDLFWSILILEWLSSIVLVCGVLFMFPDLQAVFNIFFVAAFVVGITIIALAHAHNKGRLKGLRGDKK